MAKLILQPKKYVGTVAALPSKSEAHRYVIASFLAGGNVPTGLPASDDIKATLRCVSALRRDKALDCGESGTTLRLLLPVSLLFGGADFSGRGRLPERPLADIINALSANGAFFSSKKLPLSVSGTLRAGRYEVSGAISSQFTSGLLFALPCLGGDSEIIVLPPIVSAGYVNMTLCVLRRFGITVSETETGFFVRGNQTYTLPHDIHFSGDWTDAAVFLALGALSGRVTVTGLNPDSCQGDSKIIQYLRQFGAPVSQEGNTFTTEKAPLHGVFLDLRDTPDLLPTLAVIAASSEGDSLFSGIGHARYKESDRVCAAAELIRSLGGHAEERGDALFIRGGGLRGGGVSTFGDHRIAMAAAVASCVCRESVVLDGADCVNKSHPGFFADIEAIAR